MTPTAQISLSIQVLLILVGVWVAVVVLWRRCPESPWFGWMKRIALVVTLLFTVLAPFATQTPRIRGSQRTFCLSNMKQLGIGLIMYAEENNDRLPIPEKWQDATAEFVKGKLICDLNGKKAGYAFNANVERLENERVTETVLLGESARNDRNMLIRTEADIVARHRIPNFVFLDGHAKEVKPGDSQKVFLRPTDSVSISTRITPLTTTEKLGPIFGDQLIPIVSGVLFILGLLYVAWKPKDQTDERRSMRNWTAGFVILCFFYFLLIPTL